MEREIIEEDLSKPDRSVEMLPCGWSEFFNVFNI